jgi:hypothetical protein
MRASSDVAAAGPHGHPREGATGQARAWRCDARALGGHCISGSTPAPIEDEAQARAARGSARRGAPGNGPRRIVFLALPRFFKHRIAL